MGNRIFSAHITQTPGASVTMPSERYWHLEVPTSSDRTYRLAQLDDHGGQPRDQFLWKPPIVLRLNARVSDEKLPGTWGFGFWNDPFSFLLGGDRTIKRLPTLPNAAWFFHASPENYLSFRDDLPANGYLAATFSSTKVHPGMLLLTSPALGLTLLPPTAQPIRKGLRRLVCQAASLIQVNVTDWHTYSIDWQGSIVSFSMDGSKIWQTPIVPPAPLSLVIWIDNQYASLPPRGRLRYGTLPNPVPAWLEVRDLELMDH